VKRALLGDVLIDLERLTKSEIMNINRNQNFVCERCHKPVVFKHGTRKKAHFAHVKAGIGATNPESAAHRLVKEVMARWLRNQRIHATVEHSFPAIDRIADVYFEYQGYGYVFEIQKSSMSEIEFKKRIFDYRQVGIEIIWIFLGEVKKQEYTYCLPPVMQGRPVTRLIHFCRLRANLTIFENPVYLTTKEIYSRVTCRRLRDFRVQDLLEKKPLSIYINEQWLDVKWNFRRRGWFFASKSEKKLIEQCLLRGFNLAGVPPEVGWPVPGNGINKHLFVWQTYVLVGIMKFLKIGDVFSVHDVMVILQREYQMRRDGSAMQIKMYLLWLVKLEILRLSNGYFEYVSKPRVISSMEACLNRDELLVERAVLQSNFVGNRVDFLN
jgi:competence CoiA-like predicted nuclease